MDIAICLKFFPHKYDRIAARIYIYIYLIKETAIIDTYD